MDKIITISREYGSGGRVIGKAVAEKLGVPFYDREIIELSAQKSGLAVSFVEDTEQKIKNKFLHNLAFGGRYMGVDPAVSGLSLSDKLFIATCDIIREIADRGPCVIVGRCADYILKDRPNMFDVFVYADDEHKANRIAMRNDMALDKALDEVKKTDKYRANHYDYYTERVWGAKENYNLCLNSGLLGIDKCVELITDAVKD